MDYGSLYFEALKQTMHSLIMANDVDEFRHLLIYCKNQPADHGRGFNCFIAGKGSNHTSAMLLAARHGKTEILRCLIEEEAVPVDDVNENGVSAMFTALSHRHFDTAEYLLSLSADLLIHTKKGSSLLVAALQAGSKAWVLRLLDAGLSLTEVNAAGMSMMHWAAQSGDTSLLDWVHAQTQLAYDVASADGSTPLQMAGNLAMFLHIWGKTSSLPLSEEHVKDHQLLFHFNSAGKADIVAHLLALLSDTSFLRSNKCTMVMMAVRSGNADLLRLLLENGFSPEARDKRNYRALHFAASHGRLDLARLLVETGKARLEVHENQNFMIRKTRTPLFLAIEKQHTEIALYLIAHSKDLNVLCDSSNSTALCEACEMDDLEVIRHLLEKGASPNGVNRDKTIDYPDFFRYPLAQVQSAEAVHLLMQYGADINATEKGYSASNALQKLLGRIEKRELQTHAGQRKIAAVKTLIDYGISLDGGAYGSLESSASCLELADIIRYARAHPRMLATPSEQAENNRHYWEGMLSFVGVVTGKSDEVMQQMLSSLRPASMEGKGLVLWETAQACTSRDQLEIFNSYLENATPEDLNYIKNDFYHSDNESVLHMFLQSARSSSASGYDTDEEKAAKPSLTEYRLTLASMLAKGADPNVIEGLWGGNALHAALRMLDSFESEATVAEIRLICKLLLENTADPEQVNKAGLNCYDALAYHDKADWLADFGQPRSAIRYSAIALALLRDDKYTAVLRCLQQYPVDFNQLNERGDNLMTATTRANQLDILQSLLQHGGSILDQDTDGYRVFQIACHRSAYDIANYLLDAGLLDTGLLNERSGKLQKSLLMNLNYGSQINSAAGRAVAKKLLDAGIDLNLTDADGKTIFDYPLDKRYRSLLEKYRH